jgi:prevent-host-death family protein
VCTLSEFRATIAARFERARSTSQPLIITQRGRNSAVLLGIDLFEKLLREIELLREVHAAVGEVAAGQETEHASVEVRLRGLLGR